MSLVVAIKKEDRIYLGCDSQVSCGNVKTRLPIESPSKIWAIENCEHGIMGGVGDLRAIQVLQTEEMLVDLIAQYQNQVDYKYVVRNLNDKIYETMMKFGLVTFSKTFSSDSEDNPHPIYVPRQHLPCSLIFAYKDMAYEINGDGAIIPIEDYLVIGSGDEVAIGSLEATKECEDPIERIFLALQAAGEKTIYVNDDIITACTDDEAFQRERAEYDRKIEENIEKEKARMLKEIKKQEKKAEKENKKEQKNKNESRTKKKIQQTEQD